MKPSYIDEEIKYAKEREIELLQEAMAVSVRFAEKIELNKRRIEKLEKLKGELAR